MGCCQSSNFEGEGRTLGSAPPATASPSQRLGAGTTAKATPGQRLGGAAATPSETTAAADREARAKAAEERIKAGQSKGAPTQGKLSKQLQQQRANPRSADDEDNAPERVVWD